MVRATEFVTRAQLWQTHGKDIIRIQSTTKNCHSEIFYYLIGLIENFAPIEASSLYMHEIFCQFLPYKPLVLSFKFYGQVKIVVIDTDILQVTSDLTKSFCHS